MDTEAVKPATTAAAHHPFTIGQFIGLALLAFQAYHQQDVSPDGPAVLLDPVKATSYLQGIFSLFPPPTPPPA